MSTFLKLFGTAFGAFLIGSVAFFGILSGLSAALFSPFLSIFGWSYFPLILVAVLVAWAAYRPRMVSFRLRVIFILSGGLVGSALMFWFGMHEAGDDHARWTIANIVAGGVAGLFSSSMITYWKTHVA